MALNRQLASFISVRVKYGWRDLRGDVLGGLTSAGMVLPVAIAYGVMSGLGAAAGLHGALAVGIFGSLFGGTRGLVYGPNIAVTIIMGTPSPGTMRSLCCSPSS